MSEITQRAKAAAVISAIAVVCLVSCALVPKDPGQPVWSGPAEWEAVYDSDYALGFAGENDFALSSGLYQKFLQPACQWCGATKNLEVHHILPQWLWNDPLWEERPAYGMNDPTNLVTLCRQCHFVVGHRRNFRTGMVTNFWKMLEEANR